MRLTAEHQEIILAHYRAPHRSGLREPFDAEIHRFNPTCGDELTLRVRREGEGARATVADISYQVQGCSISQASVSVMTDLVIGRAAGEAEELHSEIAALLRAPVPESGAWPSHLGDAAAFRDVSRHPARIKCALLCWTALREALS
ncbi:iron-sulfur cluster assembly scaffold protein NifU [Streptomyces sp. NBRC 13847]|uniref:Fe-S cluster assembly sulfur transfer protein SufU n=1 Tax=Streptomyces TaxID=1883 RepID=UPI0024A2FA69|nr:SUF system NifU family Fe-S cluster assembly protein [Streptomyces sp. NBRC 13847]GLW18735.1 iron-sulfur cluster assembly scaffold protein NifU [Streptomyces sp. NBRC 13847]